MSTLPIGRGMEMMDWVGVAGVGINLLMLTLAQRGKVDTDLKGKEKGKAPNNKTWAADRPVPVRCPSPSTVLVHSRRHCGLNVGQSRHGTAHSLSQRLL